MRRPGLPASAAGTLSLALAVAVAASSFAPLPATAAASGAGHHPAHAAGHGTIPRAAGHNRFAARDPASLVVERATEQAAQEALFEEEAVVQRDVEEEIMQAAVGWTEEDDLWVTSGGYEEEGAGLLQRRMSDNSTTSEAYDAPSAQESSGPSSSASKSSNDEQASSTAAQSSEATPTASSTSRKPFHGTTKSSTKVKATGTGVVDTDALETKLVLNPKFLALNPKWLATALLARPATSTTTSKPASTASAASSTITSRPSSSSNTKASSTRTASSTKTSTVALTLPAPPASTCQPQYTNTAGGAVYGPGLGDFNFLPRPSTFVKRSGNKLTLDGETYRIVGPNIYWLGLDENVNWKVTYPSKQRVREAMAITVAMGGNTIRSHTLGVSTGHSKTLWPDAWSTNNDAFDSIDYAIYAARNYGLRLIIPLTDNYAYYHGGKYDFIGWAGADTSDASQFYWNDDVIKIFKGYISVLLNHVNTYTGVALKDDPTIMAWETGNELGGYMLGGGAPPASWTKNIAAYIKKLAPNHLVADGTDGLTDYGGSLANTGMKLSDVDLMTDHFYPALQWLLVKDKNWMSSHPSKVFFVGENDWTGQKGGDDLDTFYSTIEAMDGSGSMMWSIFGHDDRCCDWIYHNDGYSLYYPNGLNSAMNKAAIKLMKHWYRMRGLTPPSALPAVACPQPELEP